MIEIPNAVMPWRVRLCLPVGAAVNIRLAVILTAIAEEYKISEAMFLSRRRTDAIAMPRMMAMYLCRQLTLCSLQEIGEFFKRDHGTVLHACRTIEGYIDVYEEIRKGAEKLKATVVERISK